MMSNLNSRLPRAILALLLATSLAACDSSSDPLAPESDDPGSTLPTVVMGRVSSQAQGAVGGAALASGEDPSGVLVTIDGTQATDTTDSNGRFRLEAISSDGRLVLRFRRGTLDARLEIEGVGPGVLISVEVTLGNDRVSLSSSRQGDHNEFQGKASFISVSGSTPGRVLRVEVTDTSGAIPVDIMEESTSIDMEGDMVTFEAILGALNAGRTLDMEGEGTPKGDGSVVALQIKVESDHDDDDGRDNNENEFDGQATLVSVTGAAGTRTARLQVSDSTGTLRVDLVEGATYFDNEGDFTSFADALTALQAGTTLKIEGEGIRQADGSITATTAKVETDDDHGDDEDNDFDGQAAFLSLTGEAPARSLRVSVADSSGTLLVDIVEGTTTFDNEGDILSFSDTLAALQAGTVLRMEGEGTRQDDGSIRASEVKVETDD